MKTKLVQYDKEAGFIVSEFSNLEDFLAGAEVRGFKADGLSKVYPADQKGAFPRAELQGQPKFKGLCGPMWDGGVLRYEDWKAYEKMSN